MEARKDLKQVAHLKDSEPKKEITHSYGYPVEGGFAGTETGVKVERNEEVKKQPEEAFRNFIRTYHLTSKWEYFLNGIISAESHTSKVLDDLSEEMKKEPEERMSIREIYDLSSSRIYNKKFNELSDVNDKLHITQYVVALLDELRYSYSNEDNLIKSDVILSSRVIEAQSKAGYWMKEFENLHNKMKDSQSEIESLKKWIKDQNEAIDKYCDRIQELESKLAALDKPVSLQSWQETIIPCNNFAPDESISSATICKFCGNEKWQHIGKLSPKEEEPNREKE